MRVFQDDREVVFLSIILYNVNLKILVENKTFFQEKVNNFFKKIFFRIGKRRQKVKLFVYHNEFYLKIIKII